MMMSFLLPGCSKTDNTLEQINQLRNSVLSANRCSFSSEITADYGDEIYSFTVNCSADSDGNMTFEVIEPTEIKGITGRFGDNYSDITFDGHVLAFPRLSDGLVTPVSAPWIFMKALRSGYIFGCANDEGQSQYLINDTYEDDPLELSLWLNESDLPVAAEISWQGRRMLTLEIKDFIIL